MKNMVGTFMITYLPAVATLLSTPWMHIQLRMTTYSLWQDMRWARRRDKLSDDKIACESIKICITNKLSSSQDKTNKTDEEVLGQQTREHQTLHYIFEKHSKSLTKLLAILSSPCLSHRLTCRVAWSVACFMSSPLGCKPLHIAEENSPFITFDEVYQSFHTGCRGTNGK